MKTFEQITNEERVGNLGPDDLIIHARHVYLSAAKDLTPDARHPGDRKLGESCVDAVLALQAVIEMWGYQ